MNERTVGSIAASSIALAVMLGTAWHVTAQDAKATYSRMAPLDQYLMEDPGSEIALARSAVPESISRDAEVLVLGRRGYETAIKGKNGFVCMVERSWTAPIDDPDFWNPKLRSPICFNGAAARSYLPRTIKKTDLILAGRTKAQMMEAIVAATRDSAKVLKLDQLGTVAPGKSADFIVLNANPLDNISNVRRIDKVYLRGQEVDRAGLRAKWQAQWRKQGQTTD